MRSIAMTLTLLCLGASARADDWQEPATLSGLVGSYARAPGSGGEILFLTLGGSDGYRAQGPYQRFLLRNGLVSLEQGSYQAIAENPAIGAIISFADPHGNWLDAWAILAIRRDPLGQKIIGLRLSGEGGIVELFRVGP